MHKQPRDIALNTLALNVKIRRKNLALTVAALAAKARIGRYSITRLETLNANTTVITLVRLAEALDCQLTDFFIDPPEPLDVPQPANASSKTTLRGVCWNQQKQKFQAKISRNKITTYLGYFDDAQDAHRAYLHAKRANQ